MLTVYPLSVGLLHHYICCCSGIDCYLLIADPCQPRSDIDHSAGAIPGAPPYSIVSQTPMYWILGFARFSYVVQGECSNRSM